MGSKVSVVIPTLNEENNIGNLIADLFNQTKKVDDIIVVDGGSLDKTPDIVNRSDKVKFINSKPSVALQRNIGAKFAKYNTLIFIDADVRLNRDFLKKATKNFNKRGFEISCPIFHPHKSNLLILFMYYFFNGIFIITSDILPSGASTTMLVKRKIFIEYKGFKNIKYEDIELIRRIGKNHNYGILPIRVFVSDRRFKEYGTLKTFFRYLLLSVFFIFGYFESASFIDYPMGKYKKN